MKGIALGNKKHSVKLRIFIAIKFKLDNLILIKSGKIHLCCLFQYLRNMAPTRMAQYPKSMTKVVMKLHITDGRYTVKPCIGNCLHDHSKTLTLYPLLKPFPLFSNL